ncbi:MAG: hypothetical protein M9930_12300 [Anaerolineae bacterium]|nr:hypothetical protein [Anaerolineae bacterium]
MSPICSIDLQRFLVEGEGAVEVAAGEKDLGHLMQRGGLALDVADLLRDLQRFLVEGEGAVEVAAGEKDLGHHRERGGLALDVAGCS